MRQPREVTSPGLCLWSSLRATAGETWQSFLSPPWLAWVSFVHLLKGSQWMPHSLGKPCLCFLYPPKVSRGARKTGWKQRGESKLTEKGFLGRKSEIKWFSRINCTRSVKQIHLKVISPMDHPQSPAKNSITNTWSLPDSIHLNAFSHAKFCQVDLAYKAISSPVQSLVAVATS